MEKIEEDAFNEQMFGGQMSSRKPVVAVTPVDEYEAYKQ